MILCGHSKYYYYLNQIKNLFFLRYQGTGKWCQAKNINRPLVNYRSKFIRVG